MISTIVLIVLAFGAYSCTALQCYSCMGSPEGSFDKNDPHCLKLDEESAVEKMDAPLGGKCSQILFDCEKNGEHVVTLAARSGVLEAVCHPEIRDQVEQMLRETLKAAGQDLDSAVIKDCSTCEDDLCNKNPY